MPCISMYISDGLFRKDFMGHLSKQIKDISLEDKNYEIKSRNYIEIKNWKLNWKLSWKIKWKVKLKFLEFYFSMCESKTIYVYFYQHQDVATLLELDRFCEDDII